MKIIKALVKEFTPYIGLYDFYKANTYGTIKTLIVVGFITLSVIYWVVV
jgi:hypothetical protein